MSKWLLLHHVYGLWVLCEAEGVAARSCPKVYRHNHREWTGHPGSDLHPLKDRKDPRKWEISIRENKLLLLLFKAALFNNNISYDLSHLVPSPGQNVNFFIFFALQKNTFKIEFLKCKMHLSFVLYSKYWQHFCTVYELMWEIVSVWEDREGCVSNHCLLYFSNNKSVSWNSTEIPGCIWNKKLFFTSFTLFSWVLLRLLPKCKRFFPTNCSLHQGAWFNYPPWFKL